MTSNTSDGPRDTAIQQLESLGLSTYAARTFVALVSLSDGTAQDVSDVADVPRTRVYDAATELEDRGLVDVQETTPKRFWAVSAGTTERQFEKEHTHRLNLLTDALDVIEPDSQSNDERRLRTISGHDDISDCVIDFIDTATDEIIYLSTPELLTGEIVDSLRSAHDRGVRITVSDHSPAVTEAVLDAIPEAKQFDSSYIQPTTPIGRLVVTGRDSALVSVIEPDDAANPGEETALVGTGTGNGLVDVLDQLL